MSSLEPLINLIVLLTVLSVAAERLTNDFKLEEQDLREKREDEPSEKERERAITWHSIMIGMAIALAVKAPWLICLPRSPLRSSSNE
jgi:hypothetical protein